MIDKPKALDLVNGVYLFKLGTGYKYELIRGKKQFELVNHLGNVLATISDKKIGVSSDNKTIDYYLPDLVTATFYSSYGASVNGYNFEKQVNAFNGQRRSPEISSTAQTAQYWEYDSRIGRRWNVDPLAQERLSLSPYNAMSNDPINKIDPTGALDDYLIRKNGEIVIQKTQDKFDRFYLENSQKKEKDIIVRSYKLLAKLDKNDAGLVKFPSIGDGFSRYGEVEAGGISSGIKKGLSFTEKVGSGDHYLKPTTAAALFGVVNELNEKGINISFGDMSSSNGSDPAKPGQNTFHHGGHGHMGKRLGLDVDFRYVGEDGNSYRGVMSDDKFSIKNNSAIYEAAKRFGSDYSNTYQGTTERIPSVKPMGGHNNHGHLGFKQSPSNVIPYLPYNQK